LLVLLAVSVFTDLRGRLILNAVTYPSILLGLALQWARGGVGEGFVGVGLGSGLAGLVSCAAVFGLFWATGGMGAGDLKLMAAVGAILGFPQALGAMLFGSVGGGVQGVLALLARTSLGRKLCARAGLSGTAQPSFAKRVPLGVGLAVGVAAFRWWLTAAP